MKERFSQLSEFHPGWIKMRKIVAHVRGGKAKADRCTGSVRYKYTIGDKLTHMTPGSSLRHLQNTTRFSTCDITPQKHIR
jgi:hypothetical protein